MKLTLDLPDSLTPADALTIEYAVETLAKQIAEAREQAAEWARRDAEKTARLMELIHTEDMSKRDEP